MRENTYMVTKKLKNKNHFIFDGLGACKFVAKGKHLILSVKELNENVFTNGNIEKKSIVCKKGLFPL